MDRTKLNQIIEHKNERREEDALRIAAEIIDEITTLQHRNAANTERIGKLREELAALTIEQIDPVVILG